MFNVTLNYISNKLIKMIFFSSRLCFGFTILMMIISYLREDTACNQNQNQNVLVQTSQPPINGTTMVYSESASNPPDVVLQCRKIDMPKRTFLDNLIDCYSIRDNYKMLISCKKSPNAVPIIDGLKYVIYDFVFFTNSNNIFKSNLSSFLSTQINRRLSHLTIPYGLVYALHSA